MTASDLSVAQNVDRSLVRSEEGIKRTGRVTPFVWLRSDCQQLERLIISNDHVLDTQSADRSLWRDGAVDKSCEVMHIEY
jgi:hypothetical protein